MIYLKNGKNIGIRKNSALQPGDSTVERNIIFRASTQQTLLLLKVRHSNNVPDDRSERIRVNNVNRLLRRDTRAWGQYYPLCRRYASPFAFYDQDGKVITTDYFDGSVTVLNFIFTRCSISEMCPASTMRMKKLQGLAKEKNIPHVKFLSITLDPLFDTPGILKSYALAYDLDESNFRLCTARKQAVDDLARQFGIFRKDVKGLLPDHTMRTMIINSGKLFISFPVANGRRRFSGPSAGRREL